MAKNKEKKVPKSKAKIGLKKHPRIEEEPSFNREMISWHVSLLEVVAPFGWHAVHRDKLDEIRQKLSQFESQTWNEILIKGKKQNHTVSLVKLCPEARERLMELKQDDVEGVISLHLQGKERIWGIRDKHILKILWWDPDHLVCPSLKKHT
ncbi:MAG: hypothetical protein WAW37_09935 [Syntrophobacteraceae bacterium]